MEAHGLRALRIFPLLVLAALASAGCTHAQLRRSTVVHSGTLSEIYTQQVLNNLAMFVQNPDALPFFAFPNQGTTSIQDTGNIGNPGYTSRNFVTNPFSLNASRQTTENWVLEPVRDPAKLALMRCAYREAIASTMGINWNEMKKCPDCRKLRSEFYGQEAPGPGQADSGDRTPCLDSPPWFHWGCKQHAHTVKPSPCHYVGSYCDGYVCVPPEGRDMLTRLTLTILDYAVNDPSQYQKRTKTVEISLNKNGEPVSGEEPVATTISATIPIDEPSNSLLVLDRSTAARGFIELFGYRMADELVAEARRQYQDTPQEVDQKGFWEKLTPDNWPDRYKRPLAYLKANHLRAQEVPSEALLKGPAMYERKGSASSGLQALQQRLKAASATP